MPTKEERRKMAAILELYSDFDFEGCNPWRHLVSALYGDEAMHNPNEVFEYLSDLIEPEPERTCHIVWNELDDTWECDACGGAVGLSYVSYCESCGAKNNNPSN